MFKFYQYVNFLKIKKYLVVYALSDNTSFTRHFSCMKNIIGIKILDDGVCTVSNTDGKIKRSRYKT